MEGKTNTLFPLKLVNGQKSRIKIKNIRQISVFSPPPRRSDKNKIEMKEEILMMDFDLHLEVRR